MADQVITKQELIDAQKDAQTLEEVISGEPGKLVETRLGRKVYTLASVPQINTMTREEVAAAVAPKANKADVDEALSNLSTNANKFYPTLAEANYYITQMAVNDVVTVGEEANKGLWYKATAGATNLTKSPYDPLRQAKSYADAAKVSPVFTGTPTAPTPSTTSNDGTLSTTKYVKDFVDEKFNRVANVSIGSAVGDVILSDFQLRSGILNIYGNPPEPVNLVFPDDTNKTYLVRMGVLPSTVVNVKFFTKSGIKRLEAGDYYLTINSLGFTLPYDKKANINSPVFTGYPESSLTPATSSNNKLLANTQFVKRSVHDVSTVNISDATTQLTGLDSNTVVIEGALTQSRELVIAEALFSCTIINKTTGSKDIILKGTGQNDPQTYVTIKPNQGKKVYTKGTVVYAALGGDASSQLPVATADVLGGIKVGSGLSITPSGTLSATGSSPVVATPLKFAGNFLNGSSYAIGDVVRHGSGVYQVTSSVTQAKSPQNDAKFTKIGHNEAAGELGKVDVISNTLEYITYSSEVPYKLSKGGNLVFNKGTNKLGVSKDYGKTWELTPIMEVPAGSFVRWVYETNDGELLCSIGKLDAPNPDKCIVMKSLGWDEVTAAAPTWSEVFSIQRAGALIVEWGISMHNNFVVMAEYGLQKGRNGSGVEEYAKYAYLSKDYGKTWKTIFNLDDFVTTNGVHLHGICFDPYWNRIWISHGDGASGGTNGLYYSDDLGVTWVSALATSGAGVNFTQSVGITALPTCILFASDSAPNGVHRIDRAQGRTPVKGFYEVEVAYTVPDSNPNGLSQILSTGYKAEWLPNAPYIWVYAAETTAGKIGCVLSWDGWIYHEVWVSDINYNPSTGAKNMVGITPENTIIISGGGDGVGGDNSKKWKRTIKVSLDAV